MAFRAIAFSALCALLLCPAAAEIREVPIGTPAPTTPAPADRPALGKVQVTTLSKYLAPTAAPGTRPRDNEARRSADDGLPEEVPPTTAVDADAAAAVAEGETAATPTPTRAPPQPKNAASSVIRPYGLSYDKARGALWVADNSGHGLYRLDATTGAETKVVQGATLTDGFNSMPNPYCIDLVREGPRRGDVVLSTTTSGRPIRIADMHNGATRGNVSTAAGGSTFIGYREGKGAVAYLRGISDVAMLPGRPDEVFFTDSGNHCVRKVDLRTTQTSRVFGRCTLRGYVEGPGHLARMYYPWGITPGAERDTFFVADQYNNIVRMVNATSSWGSTLVGRRNTASLDGYAGSGSQSASVYRPSAMSRAGDVLFIISQNSYRLSAFVLSKKYLATILVRQNGFYDTTDGGAMGASTLHFPAAVSESALFFSDYGNGAVRRVDIEWTQGVDTSVPDAFPEYGASSGAAAVSSVVGALFCAALTALAL